MIAITLHQPYATLMMLGRKSYETRTWAPRQHISDSPTRLAIHAGKSAAARHVCEEFGLEWATLPAARYWDQS